MERILKAFRGRGAAEFFMQFTEELWESPYTDLTCAEYGAFRRILAMFARSKKTLQANMMVVTRKELRMHGISMNILNELADKLAILQISLLTESSEIKDLPSK